MARRGRAGRGRVWLGMGCTLAKVSVRHFWSGVAGLGMARRGRARQGKGRPSINFGGRHS